MNREETIKELKIILNKVKLIRKNVAGLGHLEVRLVCLIKELENTNI